MIYGYIQKLIDYSLAAGLIDSDDTLVIRNQLMDALHVYDWQDDQTDGAPLTIDEILKPLIDHACENGVIEDTASNRYQQPFACHLLCKEKIPDDLYRLQGFSLLGGTEY